MTKQDLLNAALWLLLSDGGWKDEMCGGKMASPSSAAPESCSKQASSVEWPSLLHPHLQLATLCFTLALAQ